jgi:hypothetical protein
MNRDFDLIFNRRAFLNAFGLGLGGIALADLLSSNAAAASPGADHGVLNEPHFPPRAKRIIYLFMSGRPIAARPLRLQAAAEQTPWRTASRFDSRGSAADGMSGNQSSIPLVGSPFKFAQHGKGGAWDQ